MRSMAANEEKALAILRRLRGNGFIALFDGGCVRDRLLGIPIKDYDIATNARPEVVQRLFDNTVAVGALLGRMVGAPPSLAQLYASIATSEATHATALTSRISQGLAGS